MTTDAHRIETLRAQMAGSVLSPSDLAYEDARRVHNGLIDRRPGLMLVATARPTCRRCAVRPRAGLEISVRGGGHNVAGNAVYEAA